MLNTWCPGLDSLTGFSSFDALLMMRCSDCVKGLGGALMMGLLLLAVEVRTSCNQPCARMPKGC